MNTNIIDSHIKKYGRPATYAVKINDLWVNVSLCKCGQIHAYEVTYALESADILDISELSDEIRGHLEARVNPRYPQRT